MKVFVFPSHSISVNQLFPSFKITYNSIEFWLDKSEKDFKATHETACHWRSDRICPVLVRPLQSCILVNSQSVAYFSSSLLIAWGSPKGETLLLFFLFSPLSFFSSNVCMGHSSFQKLWPLSLPQVAALLNSRANWFCLSSTFFLPLHTHTEEQYLKSLNETEPVTNDEEIRRSAH